MTVALWPLAAWIAVVAPAAGQPPASEDDAAVAGDPGAPADPQADAPAVAESDAPAAKAEPDAPAAETTPDSDDDGELGPAPAGPAAVDAVLDCGVRVIAAQDRTLPVAAVVLAIETGTEDDPKDRPGLVRALAFHLLQGNRELAPGGASAVVHDAGGLTSLAIGPAQIRFESLVPISRLSQVIDVEAQRLRAPTVTKELWADTLRWARRDSPRKWASHPKAIALAHRTPSLGTDGQADLTKLSPLEPSAIGQALAERMTYTRATLTVVAPADPAETFAAIEAAFENLPSAKRAVADRTVAVIDQRTQPQPVTFDPASGELFLWPVAPTPAAIADASVWCRAINRQRRAELEPKRARVRCHLDLDPRRSTLTVRASGSDDPGALLEGRLTRLREDTDHALLQRQRETLAEAERMQLRSPLPLARRLSQSGPAPSNGPKWRALDALTGLDILVQDADVAPSAVLPLGAAIQLVPGATGDGEQ